MNINKQKGHIDSLLELIKKNPELPILPMVNTECVCGDDFCYWTAEWGSAEVTKYWVSEERIYQYDDFNELVENWIDDNCDDEKFKDLSDQELEFLAEKTVNDYEWVDAIIVYINSI